MLHFLFMKNHRLKVKHYYYNVIYDKKILKSANLIKIENDKKEKKNTK